MVFTVDYRVVDGTATANGDFRPISGTLTWYDGESRGHVLSIEIVDDEIGEPTQSFQVELLNPSYVPAGSTVNLQGAPVTIVDDDESGGGGGGGGGGGASGLLSLLLLSLADLLRAARRPMRKGRGKRTALSLEPDGKMTLLFTQLWTPPEPK
jgi:hypothetical protein